MSLRAERPCAQQPEARFLLRQSQRGALLRKPARGLRVGVAGARSGERPGQRCPGTWQSATLRPIRCSQAGKPAAAQPGATQQPGQQKAPPQPATAISRRTSNPRPNPGTSRREEFQPSRRLMLARWRRRRHGAILLHARRRKDTGMNCANHPDRERAAFCQNCGKPLCTECVRNVGNLGLL